MSDNIRLDEFKDLNQIIELSCGICINILPVSEITYRQYMAKNMPKKITPPIVKNDFGDSVEDPDDENYKNRLLEYNEAVTKLVLKSTIKYSVKPVSDISLTEWDINSILELNDINQEEFDKNKMYYILLTRCTQLEFGTICNLAMPFLKVKSEAESKEELFRK